MTLDILNRDRVTAWKAGDTVRKNVLTNMVDAINKASMTAKGRVEITEQLVNDTLQTYQKTVQEQYDECPDTADDPKRAAELKARKAQYLLELNIVKEYAPQLLTDADNIKKLILAIVETDHNLVLSKANRGYIMKTLASQLRGKADLSVVSRVVSELTV